MLSLRQREFCRHYVECLSAPEAARRAGYSATTVQHHASRLLQSPLIENRIAILRKRRECLQYEDLRIIREEAFAILQNETDWRAKVAAMNSLAVLARLQCKAEVSEWIIQHEERERMRSSIVLNDKTISFDRHLELENERANQRLDEQVAREAAQERAEREQRLAKEEAERSKWQEQALRFRQRTQEAQKPEAQEPEPVSESVSESEPEKELAIQPLLPPSAQSPDPILISNSDSTSDPDTNSDPDTDTNSDTDTDTNPVPTTTQFHQPSTIKYAKHAENQIKRLKQKMADFYVQYPRPVPE